MLKPKVRVRIYYYAENGCRELVMDTFVKGKGDILLGSIVQKQVSDLKGHSVIMSAFTVTHQYVSIYFRKEGVPI